MTMEDLLERIAAGTTTERDSLEVAQLMARHAALKLFVIEVAAWCGDAVYRDRAAKLLRDAGDAGQVHYASSSQWQWLVGRKLSLGRVMAVSDGMATVQQAWDVTQVPLPRLLEEDYRSHDRHMASLCEALNSGDGTYRP
jgi:hypothetical protein